MQAQAFGLGYALRVADLRAVAYTKAVETLQSVTDPKLAGAEVAHFSDDVPRLRHAQAESYAQAAGLLNLMGAPLPLRDWAKQSAATLNAPLVYTKDAQKLAKTEPATAAVLAELVEIQAIKAAADAQQTRMTLWLEVSGGKVTPWTADVGAYAAELGRASHAVDVQPASSITARLLLLQEAPPSAPATARESLATSASRRWGQPAEPGDNGSQRHHTGQDHARLRNAAVILSCRGAGGKVLEKSAS